MHIAGLIAGLKASTAWPGETGSGADSGSAFAGLLALDLGPSVATDSDGAPCGLPIFDPTTPKLSDSGGFGLDPTAARSLIESEVSTTPGGASDQSAVSTGTGQPTPPAGSRTANQPSSTRKPVASVAENQAAAVASVAPPPSDATPGPIASPDRVSDPAAWLATPAPRLAEPQMSGSVPIVTGNRAPAASEASAPTAHVTGAAPTTGNDTVQSRPLVMTPGTEPTAHRYFAANPAVGATVALPDMLPSAASGHPAITSTDTSKVAPLQVPSPTAPDLAPPTAARGVSTSGAETRLRPAAETSSVLAQALVAPRAEALPSPIAAPHFEQGRAGAASAPVLGEPNSRPIPTSMYAPVTTAIVALTGAADLANAQSAAGDVGSTPIADHPFAAASQTATFRHVRPQALSVPVDTELQAAPVHPDATIGEMTVSERPRSATAALPAVGIRDATISDLTTPASAPSTPKAPAEGHAASDMATSPTTAEAADGSGGTSAAAKAADAAARPAAQSEPLQTIPGRDHISSVAAPDVDAPTGEPGPAVADAGETDSDSRNSAPDDPVRPSPAAHLTTGRSGVSAAALTFAAMLRDDGRGQDPAGLDPNPALEGLHANPAQNDRTATRFAALQSTGTVPAVAQAAVEVLRHVQQGANRFQIRLDPPELGRIDVEMKFDADGGLKAHLTVERRETLDLFLRDQRGLERALDAAGVKVDSGSLQFSMKDQGSNFGAFQEGRNSAAGRNGTPGADPAAEQDSNSPTADLTGDPSLARHSARTLDIRI